MLNGHIYIFLILWDVNNYKIGYSHIFFLTHFQKGSIIEQSKQQLTN